MASEAPPPVSARITRSGGRHAVGRSHVPGEAPAGAPGDAWRGDAEWAYAPTAADPSGRGSTGPSSLPDHGRRRQRRRSLPLTVICLVQVSLALPLVWSNTAFTDEADYLWVGRLVIAHWLHGKSWPANYGHRVLSGSSFIYPPLGAIASAAGGLAGARILSVAFMLGATILLYFTASALFGRTVGIVATALWATTEPVFRLTFATYDPMAVFLVALAGWLAVEAGRRRRAGLFIASAATLALANATAYSSMVIDPVMLVFAFLVLLPRIDSRRAAKWTGVFLAAWLALFCLLITVSGSWAGIAFTILKRNVNDYQPPVAVLGAIAEYSAFIIVTALAGAVIGIKAERWRRPLLVVLGASALLVPAAQLHFRTAWALEKHLALDMWFASMAAGYGCLMAGRWAMRKARARSGIIARAGAVVLLGVLAVDWQLASLAFHKWPNTTSFVAAIRPLTARTNGPIFASAEERVAEYYTQQGSKWWLWRSRGLSLDPLGVPRSRWYRFYKTHVAAGGYWLIALFYTAPRSGPALPTGAVTGAPGRAIEAELARLKNYKLNEAGVPTLTRVLEYDRTYRLVAVGPYNTPDHHGVYAIWQRTTSGGSHP
jgi:hypothetical protein